LILADEPTGALDTQTSEEIMRLLAELNRAGLTVILVTHESDIADWARRKIVFRDGLIVQDQEHSPRQDWHARLLASAADLPSAEQPTVASLPLAS